MKLKKMSLNIIVCAFMLIAFIYVPKRLFQAVPKAARFRYVDPKQLTPLSAELMLKLCQGSQELFCPALRQMIEPYEQGQCSDDALNPQQKVVYMKTHKTGSTTLAIILYRYALRRNLHTLLPAKLLRSYDRVQTEDLQNYSKFSYYPWDSNLFETKKFSFFGFHTLWFGPFFRHIFGNDAFYLTLLREPVAHFESTYQFNNYEERYKMDVHQFIKNTLNKPKRKPPGQFRSLLGELGRFRYKKSTSFVNVVENDFNFVLITELFTESLILLGDLLCIPLTQLIWPVKERYREDRATFSANEVKALKLKYAETQQLYDHFKAKLEEQLDSFGQERMSLFVKQYEELAKYVEKKCENVIVEAMGELTLTEGLDSCESFKMGISDYKQELYIQEKNHWERRDVP